MIILVSADMKTRVALCVNKNIGLKITQFLKNDEDTEICLLYLTGDNKTHDSKIIKASGVKNKNIFKGNEIYKTDKHYLKEALPLTLSLHKVLLKYPKNH